MQHCFLLKTANIRKGFIWIQQLHNDLPITCLHASKPLSSTEQNHVSIVPFLDILLNRNYVLFLGALLHNTNNASVYTANHSSIILINIFSHSKNRDNLHSKIPIWSNIFNNCTFIKSWWKNRDTLLHHHCQIALEWAGVRFYSLEYL